MESTYIDLREGFSLLDERHIPKRSKWEPLVLILLAAVIAFIVAGGYDLIMMFAEKWKSFGP